MIEIITDSTCDIPEHLLEEHRIIQVPHTIIWGDEQYRDRVDMQPHEFYKRLETDSRVPTSSQAGVPEFQATYQQAISRGATEIIVLTVSSAMSGAYNMALNAARLVDIPVSVVDSKGPTMSLGWQVLAAARARDAGKSVSQILERVNEVRRRLVQFVGMDTIQYLQRGGRIGGAVKWVGGLLQIRPVVTINHETGLVEPVSLARTHKSMMDLLYRKFFDSFKEMDNLRVAVLHGNALADAEALVARIREEFNPKELLLNITGPVLGINTGPGALALCGYPDPGE